MNTLSNRMRGFSLLEVLVALLVISFGLLGIAGMQAISISNTGVAGSRSIAALQAARMAAAMSANEGYWQQYLVTNFAAATVTTTVNGTTVASNDASVVGQSTICTYASLGSAGCSTPSLMAAYDLQRWGADLQKVLPGGTGGVTCSIISVSSNNAATCQITIYWLEKSLVQNQATSVAANSATQDHYQLEVQP